MGQRIKQVSVSTTIIWTMVIEMKIFDSSAFIVKPFTLGHTQDEIKKEPMFFNASIPYAWEHGGPITKNFIQTLPDDYHSGVFDSRCHMLMPGWYPAIPGWHHDDVPRPEKIPAGQHFMTAGQPDYDNPRYKSRHIMGLVNGVICPTKFIFGKCEMQDVPPGELVYRQWHKEIEALIAKKEVRVMDCPDNQLVAFDWQAFHTGVKAVSNGWRWFGRVSINTERIHKITNEIRSQVQVYLEFPMEGW